MDEQLKSYDGENQKEKNEKKYKMLKDIICPKCKQNILIDIKDFKINLHGCKNNHTINNILLDNFKETQKEDLTKILCNICNKNNCNNNEFYICNTCNKNICSFCYEKHDKNHIIINYIDKNFICKKHNESFTQYCKTCEEKFMYNM